MSIKISINKYLIFFFLFIFIWPSQIFATGPGNAINFDGVNDYVVVNDATDLNLSATGTWEFWIKRQANGNQTILSKTSNYLNNGFYISLSSDSVIFSQGNGGSILTTNSSAGLMPVSEWHHVAVVKNGINVSIYIDGADATSTQGTHVNIITNIAELAIGIHNDGTQIFPGQIDDIRIWNIARTSEQISDNMNTTLSGSENGLVAYWQFDESSGDLADDFSTSNHYGSLVNAPTWVASNAPIYDPEGPGGVGGINGFSTLCLWLKADTINDVADGQSVSVWTDHSGLNNHFAAVSTPSFVQNAQNNQPAIVFDGAGDYFRIDNTAYLNPAQMSLFAVANPTALSEENDIMALWGNDPSYVLGVYQNKGYANFVTDAGLNSVQNTSVFSGWTILDAHWANITYLFENGEFIGTNSDYQGLLRVNSTDEIRIGNIQFTTEYFWQGHISEIIMFSKPISDTEQVIVQNYLSAKYAIPLTPTSLDKYTSTTYTSDLAGIGFESGLKKHTACSAGLLLKDNGFLDDSGDYVFVGHKSIGNSVIYDSLPSGIQMRWERIWNMQRTEQGSGASQNILMAFDFEKSGFEYLAGSAENYSLLYRSGTSGSFSIVNVASTKKSGNKIIFEISSNNLINGYYTIGCSVLPGDNGPGGVGSIDARSALSLWLDADAISGLSNGDSITTWYDISGNQNSFTSNIMPAFEENSKNSLPSVYFDGIDDYFSIMNKRNLNPEEISIFSVVYYTGNSSEHEIISLWNINDDAMSSYAMGVINDKGYATFLSSAELNSISNLSDIAGWTIMDTSWSRNWGQKFFENGQNIGQSNTATGPLKKNTSDNIMIGAINYASPYYWKGNIAEIIVYTVPLNSAQHTIVQNYLSAKYAIDLTPTTLDKYTSTTYTQDVSGIGRENDGKKAKANSAGLILLDNNNFLNDNGDYIMAGHNTYNNSYSADNVTGIIKKRWFRSWYINKTESNMAPSDNLKIGFDFNEGDIDESPSNPQEYSLLYRSDISSDFSIVQISAVEKNNDILFFQISDTDLINGYYTIGTITSMNDQPEIADILPYTTFTDTAISIPLIITDSDVALCSLTLTSNAPYFTYTCNAGNYTATVGPLNQDSGTLAITITVENTSNLTSSISFPLTITRSRNALDFDGADDYVRIDDHNLLDITGNLTLEVWVYPASLNSTSKNYILGKWRYGDTNNCSYSLEFDNLKPTFSIQTDSGNYSVTTLDNYDPMQWIHISGIKDGNTLSILINGFVINTSTITGTMNPNETPLDIGRVCPDTPSNQYFEGIIDEIRVWNTALNETGIQLWIYKEVNSNHPVYANLIAYYKFNSSSGRAAFDAKNNIHGRLYSETVSGIASWVSQIPFSNWIHTGTANWNTASNWESNFLPDIFNPGFVVLNEGKNNPVLSAPSYCSGLVLNKGASFVASNANPLTITKGIYRNDATTNILSPGSLTVMGSIDIRSDISPPFIQTKNIFMSPGSNTINLFWYKAIDDKIDTDDLEYCVYISTYQSSCVSTKENIFANAAPCNNQQAISWQKPAETGTGTTIRKSGNDLTVDAIGLSPNETYYIKILVRDEEHNISEYDVGQTTTTNI